VWPTLGLAGFPVRIGPAEQIAGADTGRRIGYCLSEVAERPVLFSSGSSGGGGRGEGSVQTNDVRTDVSAMIDQIDNLPPCTNAKQSARDCDVEMKSDSTTSSSKRTPMPIRLLVILTLIAPFLLALGCGGSSSRSSPASSQQTVPTLPAETTPAKPTTTNPATPQFEDLRIGDAEIGFYDKRWIQKYSDDRAGTDAQYKGKLVRIPTTFREIGMSNGKVTLCASTYGEADPSNIITFPLDQNDPFLKTVKKGAEIEVLGYLLGREDDGKSRGTTPADKEKFTFVIKLDHCRYRIKP
jgi:hypothetical protein